MHFRKFTLIIESNLGSFTRRSEYSLEYQVIFGANLLGLGPQRNLIQTMRKLYNLGRISVSGYHQEVNFKRTLII